MTAVIRPMIEADLPAAKQICHAAFGTFLGAPDPSNFWMDRDYVYGRFGAEHVTGFAAEAEGEVVGSNFASRWGSVGFFGPLSVRPDRQGEGHAKGLVAAVSNQFDAWGTAHNGLMTFPHSPLHLALYGKFGFYPRFLTAIMAAPARPAAQAGWSRYSELADSERQTVESACRDLTEELYEGLDLAAEIRTATARRLGDTLLLWQGPSRLEGFAVCHWGPASEAGESCVFIKFGAVRGGSGGEERFARLLDAGGALSAQLGFPKLLTGVNLAREEAYRQMVARGFSYRNPGRRPASPERTRLQPPRPLCPRRLALIRTAHRAGAPA